MPEGPEVQSMIDQLNKIVNGKTLNDITINSGRYSRKAPDGFNDFTKNIPAKLISANCKGKFIWFEFDNGWKIWNTLGMTGGWKKSKMKHSHFTFTFDNIVLYYEDVRNFGTMKFNNSKVEFTKKIKSLGTDIFEDDFTLEYVHKIMKTKRNLKKTIVNILMNQKLFCGVGNYLKAEILYACKISPHRLVEDLTENDIKNIHKFTKKISLESYKHGGASVRDYSNLENKDGEYTNFLKVYGRKTDPLGNKVKKEETSDKRTTHWVPELQN
jgi:DNA-formamidopyrimidine glycosylase|tara:strand:- start:57 stop:866 length:810 start_codon:yes stop_codon:yes gene_type:complete